MSCRVGQCRRRLDIGVTGWCGCSTRLRNSVGIPRSFTWTTDQSSPDRYSMRGRINIVCNCGLFVQASRLRTRTSKALTASSGMNVSISTGFSAWIRPATRSKHGGKTIIPYSPIVPSGINRCWHLHSVRLNRNVSYTECTNGRGQVKFNRRKLQADCGWKDEALKHIEKSTRRRSYHSDHYASGVSVEALRMRKNPSLASS